jgi:hypothetical protein
MATAAISLDKITTSERGIASFSHQQAAAKKTQLIGSNYVAHVIRFLPK